MATRIDPSEIEEPTQIPWAAFTDGLWWEITAREAERYSGSLTGFRWTLYSYARRNSLTVTTRTLGERMRFVFKEK